MSPDDFFATLLEHKGILDNCPFLVSGDEDGLEKAYCLLHASTQDLPKAKQTRHIHKRVQGYFKAIHDISKTLFVLVAASVSTRNLASLHEDEIFPSIEQWWQCHPPSERFEAHSLSLLCKLEERRRKGELVHRARRSRTFPMPRRGQNRRAEQSLPALEPPAGSANQPVGVDNTDSSLIRDPFQSPYRCSPSYNEPLPSINQLLGLVPAPRQQLPLLRRPLVNSLRLPLPTLQPPLEPK
ncbi:hypothetical protein VTN31DRAFT_3729 [Thermomyces dupontii]|uniref:uncharacterized protein n=1 Tax=Talaromyces thermophilus TaxID=28565 RepID=UPI0037443E6E